MSGADRKGAPSKEFQAVLRDAGVECWLEPGNNMSFPPRETREGRLLASPMSYWTADTLGAALRSLVRQVNMNAARSTSRSGPAPGSEVQSSVVVSTPSPAGLEFATDTGEATSSFRHFINDSADSEGQVTAVVSVGEDGHRLDGEVQTHVSE